MPVGGARVMRSKTFNTLAKAGFWYFFAKGMLWLVAPYVLLRVAAD